MSTTLNAALVRPPNTSSYCTGSVEASTLVVVRVRALRHSGFFSQLRDVDATWADNQAAGLQATRHYGTRAGPAASEADSALCSSSEGLTGLWRSNDAE